MNLRPSFAVAGSSSSQELFPFFFVLWVGFGLGSWAFISSRPTPQLKKQWSDRMAIAAGVIFFCFVFTMIALSPGPNKKFFAVLIFGPACALISWLNIRNVYYCSKCGKRSLNRDWFTNSPYHCPNCGHKLK